MKIDGFMYHNMPGMDDVMAGGMWWYGWWYGW